MNEAELYEKQYGEKKLISVSSFPFLHKVFKNFDLHREDLALSMLDEGDKLLDIGCGSGSLMFKAKAKFKEVHGIDISSSRIKMAEKQAVAQFGDTSGIHFYTCNINDKIDFSDAMFDAVTSIAVIEHIFDPYFVINQIHRVLKKDGVFIAEVPNIAYLKHRIRLFFGKLPITSSPSNWKEIGWDGGASALFYKKNVLQITGGMWFQNFKSFRK